DCSSDVCSSDISCDRGSIDNDAIISILLISAFCIVNISNPLSNTGRHQTRDVKRANEIDINPAAKSIKIRWVIFAIKQLLYDSDTCTVNGTLQTTKLFFSQLNGRLHLITTGHITTCKAYIIT